MKNHDRHKSAAGQALKQSTPFLLPSLGSAPANSDRGIAANNKGRNYRDVGGGGVRGEKCMWTDF